MITEKDYLYLKSSRIRTPIVGKELNLITRIQNDKATLFNCSRVVVVSSEEYIVVVRNQNGNELLLNFDDDWIEVKVGRRNTYESFLTN